MTPNVILRSSLAATLGWLALAAAGGLASAAPMVDPRGGSVAPLSAGSYAWPVQGPVLHGFEPPQSPFGAGHRGIDIGAPYGSDMVAAQDGTVAFAGWVGGSLFISIDHPDGVRSTYSWLSEVLVAKGADVSKGELIGRTGHGHPDVVAPHLHFGTRIGDTYVDPMLYLERGSVVGLIHLAPLAEAPCRPDGAGLRLRSP